MDAWRTSCPRITVWEDSLDAGFVARARSAGEKEMVAIADEGPAFFKRYRRP